MRAAFIVSAVLHISLLGALLITLPNADPFSTSAVAALPVELVTIEDETDVTVGEADEDEIVVDAAPETVEAEAPPEPEEMPGATDEPADTIATAEDARAEAPESASPDPVVEAEPAPETTEAEPQAEPTPPAPEETEVAVAEPQESVAEPEPEPERVPETVVPQRRPPPPPRRTEQARAPQASQDAFNADRLSQLINRTDNAGGGSGAAQASLGSAAGRDAAALTLSEKDALRSQMQRCWNPPVGLAGGDALVVVVRIRLTPDGSVEFIDDVGGSVAAGTLYTAAADAARRAVIQCQPYRLPTAKYDAWKDIQVTFDPRDLF